MFFLFLFHQFTSVVYGVGVDCARFPSMGECTDLTVCFWKATGGGCNNVNEWSKIDNWYSLCGDQTNMFDCYDHAKCFWHSQKGSCEDFMNWAYTDGIIDPASRSCDFWTAENECWNVEKCYWDPRKRACETIQTKTPVRVSPWATTRSGDTGVTKSPVVHHHTTTFPGIRRPTTIAAPTSSPTRPWMPMNKCESLPDRKSCAYGDNCIWDFVDRKCLSIDGDCIALHTENLCGHSEECTWSGEMNECRSTCHDVDAETACAYSDECFWESEDEECLPTKTSCDRLETPTYCSWNDECFWDDSVDQCLSVWGECSTIIDDAHCELNDGCMWDDENQECTNMTPESTMPVIITCEDIIDSDICKISNSTEHDMPCVWDDEQKMCTEFDFDCEDFTDMKTCNHASFRGVECVWEGECNELTHKLQSARPFYQTSSTSSDERQLDYIPYAVCFIVAMFVGCLLGKIILVYCGKKSAESLQEPLSLEAWTPDDQFEVIRVV